MRRFLVALIAWALIGVGPAFAGITQITGTGVGSAVSNNQFSGSGTVAIPVTANIPANSLVAVIAASCSTGTASFAVSDTHSNSYTAPRAVDTAAGAFIQIFYSYITTQINNGDNITVTLTGTTGCLTGQALAFGSTSSSPYDVSTGVANSGGTGTVTIGPTSTLACPGGAAGCEVLVGSVVMHATGTVANDANFTSVTPVGAGQAWITGFWIVGATTARSYAPSVGGSAVNYAGQLVAFKAASGVTPVCKRSLMGVGC